MKRHLILSVLASLLSSARAADRPAYTLRDSLNRAWTNERVTYAVAPDQAAVLKTGARLVDGAGAEVPWQWVDGGTRLTFQATVPPLGEHTYRFVDGAPATRTDLALQETPDYIELSNGRTGIRLAKAPRDGAGPLAGWKLASGAWAGGSRFDSAKPAAWEAAVAEKGPVVAAATLTARWADGGSWTVAVELESGEPLIRIRESFSNAPPGAGRFTLTLDRNFTPAHLLYRAGGSFDIPGGKTRLGQLVASPITNTAPADLFLLEPWTHWQYSLARGTWFTLVDPNGDSLVLGTADSPGWVDPALPPSNRAPAEAMLRRAPKGGLEIGFDVKQGGREYYIGSLASSDVLTDLHGKPATRGDAAGRELDEALAGGTDKALEARFAAPPNLLDGVPPERLHRAPLPQQALIRHADFPLDPVKDMILFWEHPDVPRHPRLLVSPAQLEAFKADYRIEEKELRALRKLSVNAHKLDSLVPAYLGTADAELERLLVDASVAMMQEVVDMFVNLEGTSSSVGVAPHNRYAVLAAINLADTILSAPGLPPEQARRLRGQLAFLGYLYTSPAFWSPERGYGAMFVNMHTAVASVQCAVAGILPDHPRTRAWMDQGMGYMRKELLANWVDADGRWNGNTVEAPHYGMGSYDGALAAAVMAAHLGLGDDLSGPALKLMGEFYAKISTPPDPRWKGGWRHLPPIGNTYKFEPSGIFGLVAAVYRDRDPAFSARMQWMQQQQGNPVQPGVGGFFAPFAGYRRVLINAALPAAQPAYGSEWFRGAGAVLRSSYGTPHEMMLYLIAGEGASPVRHYDRDQGALTLWGRANPIADDFGYTGCAPAEDQSLLESPAAQGVMQVEALETGAACDYLQGRQGGWLRQAVLVKRSEAMPEAPEYFVIHDSLASPAAGTWRLWLTAEPVGMGSAKALLVEPKPKAADAKTAALEGALAEDGNQVPGVQPGLDRQDKAFSIGLGERDVLVNGYSNRQTDIVFAALPPEASLKTELKTRAPAGVDDNGAYQGQVARSQVGLILQSPGFDSLLTLVFPRLKDEPAPEVTPIAGNRGFRIRHAGGVDYVFLSERPVGYKADGAEFAGAVGVIRTAGGKTVKQVAREAL